MFELCMIVWNDGIWIYVFEFVVVVEYFDVMVVEGSDVWCCIVYGFIYDFEYVFFVLFVVGEVMEVLFCVFWDG